MSGYDCHKIYELSPDVSGNNFACQPLLLEQSLSLLHNKDTMMHLSIISHSNLTSQVSIEIFTHQNSYNDGYKKSLFMHS